MASLATKKIVLLFGRGGNGGEAFIFTCPLLFTLVIEAQADPLTPLCAIW